MPEFSGKGIKSHLLVLPVLFLFFLSVLVINLGINEILKAKFSREISQQREEAEGILDSISEVWDFQSQLTLLGGGFRIRLQEIIQAEKDLNVKTSLIRKAESKFFGPPFPANQLWVMSFDPKDSGKIPQVLVHPEKSKIGKRSYSLAMRHLVRNALDIPEKEHEFRTGRKLIEVLFGKHLDSGILYQEKVGKAIPILHNREQYFLYWDFIQNSENLPVAGFFILTRNNQNADKAGFQVALRNSGVKFPLGFIKFHPSPFSHILHGPWNRHPAFRSRILKFLRETSSLDLEKNRSRILSFELPSGNLFIKLIPGCTHLGATIIPKIGFPKEKSWLSLFNFSSFLFFSGFLFYGFFFQKWPKFNLQTRFIFLYCLSTAFPLISVGFLANFYFQEKKEALILDLQRRLKAELISIDLGNDKIRAKMHPAYHQGVKNPEFAELIEREGIQNSRIFEILQAPFSQLGASFPIPLIAFFDFRGGENLRSGTFLSPEKHRGILKFLRSGLVSSLWRGLEGKLPPEQIPPNPLSREEDLLLQVYEGASAYRIANMLGDTQDRVSAFSLGDQNYYQIHDLLTVDGIDKYAVLVIWQNKSFSRIVFQEVMENYLKSFPDGLFMIFQWNRGTLESMFVESRHYLKFRQEILDSGFRTGTAVKHDEKGKSISVFMSSRRNPDQIYACSAPTKVIYDEINKIFIKLMFVFVIWFLATTALLWLTMLRIVHPIRNLTNALNLVSKGVLDRTLTLNRQDELGQISDTFDSMVDGLKKRKRMSSMISQKAKVDLFSEKNFVDGTKTAYRTEAVSLVSDIRSFTTICENRPTLEVTSLLNKHFDEMGTVIHRHGGRVDKFIGDAIQAVFEENDQNDISASLRAVHAGKEILDKLEEINKERVSGGFFPYSAGIGIAKGTVIVGGFGDKSIRADYSVMGAPMEEAARLEALSKNVPYLPLVISPPLAEDVRGCFPEIHSLPGFEKEAFVFPFRSKSPGELK